jgi:Na+-driven multidrug efflux pump
VVPIAAHQVVTQLWLLSSLIVDSVAIAGQTLVAVQLGKGDVREARVVSNRLLGLGIGAGVALAGAFWLAEPILPGIFSNDAGGCGLSGIAPGTG